MKTYPVSPDRLVSVSRDLLIALRDYTLLFQRTAVLYENRDEAIAAVHRADEIIQQSDPKEQ